MPDKTPTPSPQKRSTFVTLLVLAVFLLSSVNLARATAVIARRDVFSAVDAAFPLELTVIGGVVWGLAWLAAGIGLWLCKEWARRGILVLLPLYVLTWLGEQLWLVRGDYERGQLPFQIAVSVLLVGIVLWGLTRTGIRLAFQHGQYHEEPEHNDHRP